MRGGAWAGGGPVTGGASELLSPASPPGGQGQIRCFQIDEHHPTSIRLPVCSPAHQSTYLLTYLLIYPAIHSPTNLPIHLPSHPYLLTYLPIIHPSNPHSSFGPSAPLLSLCSLFHSLPHLPIIHLPVHPSFNCLSTYLSFHPFNRLRKVQLGQCWLCV